MRRSFRAIDPEGLVELRKKLYDQKGIPKMTQFTAWRIENGRPCTAESAKAFYSALRTKIPFEKLFKATAGAEYFGWPEVESAAAKVGKNLFHGFKATVVLSYVGPSSIFASLAMANAPDEDGPRLVTPVHLAMHMTFEMFKKVKPPHGFITLKDDDDQPEADQCVVLMPGTLDIDDPKREHRIAFIDDALITGRPLRLIRHYLKQLGYRADAVQIGCCVCHKVILAQRDETTPATYGFATNIDPLTENVRFPWGDAVFFPRKDK